ncbi:DNA gyrase subunit A [Longilinea arvoryzae]|uniref:DNA gyrase subunit A n=1 Tax=Longilinea arvoryzae TaxID=360412 RepID=A0A0S7BI95_9CHLR|nr:DNA gyrase subunit A [Longilinea arvoryzae]GAP15469.1 DNA gyrase subunit A [Longilinea arvoryzae]
MDIGTIQPVDIDEQMRTAYLDYAMSVIVARALPDARDGLKPVHRRILYAMQELGIRSNTAYKKSARIVGEVLGKYHPHGDSAVYDAMARMAQDFSMRYPLVDGQGNFGSVDGDPPAAMRYTEARLSAMAEEMLVDIEKNTVDFAPNFDGSLQEPMVLPSRSPDLLLNGSSGIAVGMATNIPPHNLKELCNAIIYLIDNYTNLDDVTIEDLMERIPGPDFPTGGVIVGREGIRQAYSTGRGRLIVRGLAHIEEMKGGRYAINITEIPYQVNKTGLIERIAELVREDKIDQISDLRDESDRRGMSIVIELKRGAQPKMVLNQLFKYTPLQTTFGVHLLALVDNEPRVLSLKRALQIFVDHREVVITRRSEFELQKARARAHILDGLLIALANLDDVIQTIRQARDADTAKINLVERFKLTEIQAQAILDLQLRRLAALERQKIEDEHTEVMERIAYLEDLLANPKKILSVIQDDLRALSDKFGDDRRTRITAEAHEDLKIEDLVPDEAVLVTITQRGYIKRTAANLYRTQNRGGRGVSGQSVREEDEVVTLLPGRSLDTLLFFSDRGKVYSEKAYNLPDAGRTDKGISIVNVLALEPGERITAALSVQNFEAAHYCTMATVRGRMKRVALSEFANVRPSGLIAITLDSGDELGWARLTHGKDDVILVTAGGQALRIAEDDIRVMGRTAGGVAGMKLKAKDRLTSMEVVEPDGYLLVVTRQGFGKRVSLAEYPRKGRATGGVITQDVKNMDRTGQVVSARVVQEADDVTFISSNGIVLRLKVKDISLTSRATRGVHLMDLGAGDAVASVARFPATNDGEFGKEKNSAPEN